MQINRILFVVLALSIIILSACGSCNKQDTISYSIRKSTDSTYQIEVPTEILNYKMAGDMMSFKKDKNGQVMASIMELPFNSDLDNYISARQNNSFTYTSLHGEDPNTRYFKVTRGNNFWIAYDFYGIKEVNGITYIVNLNSDSYSKQKMDSVFTHMYKTLQSTK